MASVDRASLFLSGNTGEANVENVLIYSGIEFYRNMYFKDKSGEICQTDFLAVCDDKLIAIEVKNYSKCVVIGDTDGKFWTVCYRNSKRSLYNPILQNDKHINIVKDMIGEYPIYNLVVFTGSSKLSVNGSLTGNKRLVTLGDLWYNLMDLSSPVGKQLDLTTVRNKILEVNKKTSSLAREHRTKYFR